MSEFIRENTKEQWFGDRIAIVTGATGGLGRVITRELHDRGAQVIAVDRAASDLADSDRLIVLSGDITDRNFQATIMDQAEELGGAHLLVNNAALAHFGNELPLDPSEDEVLQVLQVNLLAARTLGHAAAKQMMQLGRPGNVINITSIHDRMIRMQEHYSMAKAGLAMVTREMAVRYAPDGIRFNAVAPGAIDTTGRPSQFGQRKVPLGRKADPQEIANVVAFVGSDLASYMTGSTVTVDGGSSNYTWHVDDYLQTRLND